MVSAFFAAAFNSLTTFYFPSSTSYVGSNVSSSTPISLFGRSRTCPTDALTRKSFPMNLLIVFAFAGDSTMTRFLAIAERQKVRGLWRNSSRAREGGTIPLAFRTGRNPTDGGLYAADRPALQIFRPRRRDGRSTTD